MNFKDFKKRFYEIVVFVISFLFFMFLLYYIFAILMFAMYHFLHSLGVSIVFVSMVFVMALLIISDFNVYRESKLKWSEW